MKFILSVIASCLIATAAMADVMVIPNQANGYVVLTTEACEVKKSPDLYKSYSFGTNQREPFKVEGCWLQEQDIIAVAWFVDGEVMFRYYDAQDFKLQKSI